MKSILLIGFFLLTVLVNGQSQMLNGVSLDGPNGFEKTDDLTWSKGNDIITVASFDIEVSNEEFSEGCKMGSRASTYLTSFNFELNEKDYFICLQIGDNEMLIAQTPVFKNGYTFLVSVGTYPGDYYGDDAIDQAYEQIGYMIGYMITRITTF